MNEYREVLRYLMTNPHISLGDLVYQVREREGKGWNGPAVRAWSDAVEMANKLLNRHEEVEFNVPDSVPKWEGWGGIEHIILEGESL